MDFATLSASPFSCVPSESLLDDTSRLPPYRPSHLHRFHPYARTTPTTWQRILTADEEYPPEDMRPVARRSSFALTDDMFLNGEIEIVVERNSVKMFIEQHWRSRKFRVAVDYFTALLTPKRKRDLAVAKPVAAAVSVLKKRKREERD